MYEIAWLAATCMFHWPLTCPPELTVVRDREELPKLSAPLPVPADRLKETVPLEPVAMVHMARATRKVPALVGV